jgi:DNA polymerase beta
LFVIKLYCNSLKKDGVGKQILLKINQYLKTGQIEKLEKVKSSDEVSLINQLVRISGVGPVAARDFITKGIKSIDDLKKKENDQYLSHHQRIGLKYFDDFELRIPRDEMDKMAQFICNEIKAIDSKYIVTIAGSYRRGAQTSGDIDVLITHPMYMSTKTHTNTKRKSDGEPVVQQKQLIESIVNKFEEKKFITDRLAFGNTKFMVI